MPSNSWKRALCFVGIIPLGGRAESQTVRDSAGVRIVENAQPVLTPARAWRLAPTPLVDIGTASGDSVYEFSMVMGVARLRDGRIAVGVQGSNSIRFFDATGRYLHAVGRKGEGPGEFTQLLGLQALDGDTLFVIDPVRIKVFTGDGTHIRDGPTSGALRRFMFPAAVLTATSFIATRSQQPRERSGEWTDSIDAYHVSIDGSRADSIGRFPNSRVTWEPAARWTRSALFGARPYWVGARDGFYFGYSERYSIGFYAPTGAVRRIVRRAHAIRPLPASAIKEYKDRVLAVRTGEGRPLSPQQLDRIRASIGKARFAESLPAFSTLAVDRAGNLWVNQYAPWVDMPRTAVNVLTSDVPTQWDVFDPQGRWLCTVTLPASFAPLDIGADYVAGLWRDADEVEHVRLYRLLKP